MSPPRALLVRHADLCLVLLYGLLAAAFFWPLLGGGLTLWFNDTHHYYYPARDLLARSVAAGHLPLWTELIGGGYPLLAEGQSGSLYPGQVLFWLPVPTHRALSWTVFGHGWLAGSLMHGYLRSVGCRPLAAAVGAVSWMFGGAFVGHLVYVSMAFGLVWLPGVCWGYEVGVRRRRVWPYALAGAALAMSLTAVHMQLVIYVAVTGVGYSVCRALAQPGWRLTGVVATGGSVALAGLLAAAQLVPMVELVGQSGRDAALVRGYLTQYPLTLMWVQFLFMPKLFGHPTADLTQWSGTTVPWELAFYGGTAMVVLALAAPLVSRRRLVWWLAGCWWLTFWLGWGRAGGLFELVHSLPVLNAFRIPARWLLPGSFAGAALAALAVDAIGRDPDRKRLAAGTAVALAGVVVVVLSAWLTVDVSRARLSVEQLRGAWLAVGWFIVLAVVSLALVGCGRGRRWLAPAVAGLLVVDLFVAHRDYNPMAPPTAFSPAAPPEVDCAVDRVRAALGPGERVYVPQYTPAHPFLKPITNALVDIPNLDNFLPLVLHSVDGRVTSWERPWEQPWLAGARDHWLLAAERANAELDQVAANQRVAFLRSMGVRMTLARYGPVGAVGDADGFWWMPGEIAPRAGWRGSPLPYQRFSPGREVVGPGPAGVWELASAAYPAWRGFDANGRRLEVGTADGVRRAVTVEAETAQPVRLIYAGASLRFGLFCSLLGLAGLAVGWRLR